MHASHGIEDIGITRWCLPRYCREFAMTAASGAPSAFRLGDDCGFSDAPLGSPISPQLSRSSQSCITVRSTIDCLLATLCIEEGHTLLHHDGDFDPFERYLGLDVLHPGSPAPIK